MASRQPTRLRDFPSDIYRVIGREDPLSLRSLRQTEKTLHQRVKQPYEEILCKEPVSKKEIRNYIETIPSLFGLLYHGLDYYIGRLYFRTYNENQQADYYGQWNHVDQPDPDVIWSLSYLSNANVTTIQNIMQYLDHKDLHDFEMDLKSMYRIYQKRLGCLSNDYAKKETIRLFERKIEEYIRDSSSEKPGLRGAAIFAFHVYIYINVRCLNLDINVMSGDSRRGNDESEYLFTQDGDYSSETHPVFRLVYEKDLRQKQKEIEACIPLIREELECLH